MERVQDTQTALEWVQQPSIQDGAHRVAADIAARVLPFISERARRMIQEEEDIFNKLRKNAVVLDQAVDKRYYLVVTHDLQLGLEVIEERKNMWEGRFSSHPMRVFSYQPLGAPMVSTTNNALNQAIAHAADPCLRNQKKAEQKALMQAIWDQASAYLQRFSDICKEASDGALTVQVDSMEFLGEFSAGESFWTRWFGTLDVPHYRRNPGLGENYSCSSVEYAMGLLWKYRANDNPLRRGAFRFELNIHVPPGSETRKAALRGLGA